jgi:PAT family beta-lactamase induction signal transducer AmpG
MPSDPGEGALKPRRSWGEAIALYTHRPVIVMLFLGFSAGLPFPLLFATLSTWLTEVDVSRSVIGFFSWVGITFSIKVLWAPVVDRMPLPFFTRLLGARRGWMLLAQIGIALGLLGVAASDPASDLQRLALFAVLVAFASATQDIVIDAYRIEALPEKEFQGAMAASYVAGYRVGMLVGGAGALSVVQFFGWPGTYALMAVLMGVGMATVLVIREPERNVDRQTILREAHVVAFMAARAHLPVHLRSLFGWFYGAVVSPFVDFFVRNGRSALVILLFIGIYRLSDITMGIMANPFYIDLGFTREQIAVVGKVYGFLMLILGGFFGGVFVARYGIMRPLLAGAVLVAVTNLLFALLARSGPDIDLLIVAISADNLSGGFAVAAFVAYLSSLTNAAYTATQYALFSSLMTLPGKVLGGFSGVIVEGAGYFQFFLYASAVGLPAIVLVIYLMNRARAAPVGSAAPEG